MSAEETTALVRRLLERVRGGWVPDVIVEWLTIRGTHRHVFQDIAPTGREVTVSFTAIVRIEDRRLVEEWGGLDLFDLRRQLQTVAATGAASTPGHGPGHVSS
jgi:hypothetical protein